MIKDKKTLNEYLTYESRLYHKKSTNSFIPRISEKGLIWKYIILLRIYEYLFNKNKKIRYLFYLYRLKKLGFSVPLNVIEKGFLIYRTGNLVINAKHIGQNFSIAGTAFLVAKGQNSDNPVLGNNVSLGMNVTIIGGVNIASMVAIGAGSVVTKSFLKENITIAGNPAKIINDKSGSSSWGGWQNKFGE